MCSPATGDVTEPWRNLSKVVLDAMRIIHVDVRPETRTPHNPGYRQRVTMIRFFWAATFNATAVESVVRTGPWSRRTRSVLFALTDNVFLQGLRRRASSVFTAARERDAVTTKETTTVHRIC